MELTPQRQNIQDVHAFIRAVASTLEQMHARQEPHGSVLSMRIVEWLDETGQFHAEKFHAARALVKNLPNNYDSLQFDVWCFADISIERIAGPAASSDQSFQAHLYLGKAWPEVFLRLLEDIAKNKQQSCVTMEALSSALQRPVTAAESAVNSVQPADDSQVVSTETAIPHASEPPSPLVKVSVPSPKTPLAPVISFALPNATVGKPYCLEAGRIARAIAGKRGDNPETAQVVHLQLPEDHGLSFDKLTGAVSGTPTQAFEGPLSLGYVVSSSSGILPLQISLLINPNPASLWKELDPPADAPYQKELLDHSEALHGPFRIVAASRRGRSHANKGEFRDDDYAIGYAADTGWLVIVVADGAGSATYSRRGSQIACAVAKDRLVGVLDSAQHNQAEALYTQHRDWQHPEVKKALRQSLYEAALLAHHKLRAEVAKPAEPLPAPPTLRNYDTTLILLVMKKTGEGCVVATFAIGDGGAGILPHPGEGIPITHADSGEHAGQTIFLTFDSTIANDEANLEKRFHLVQTAEFTGALAMTDGITDPKFPSDAAFADPAQWASLWAELQPVLTSSPALLEWMNFFSPGNHDDRTLVAVLPAQTAAPATS